MLELLISDHILPHLRHQFAAALPDISSAHLAESLASGLGFASNAALRRHLVESKRIPAILDFDYVAMSTRLGELSGRIEDRSLKIAQIAHTSGYAFWGLPLEALESMYGFERMHPVPWSDLPDYGKLGAIVHAFCTGLARKDHRAFIEEDCTEHPLLLIVAEIARRNRTLDPLVSDILVLALPAQHAAAGDLGWVHHVHETFANRIQLFLENVCLTWNLEIDPLDLRLPEGVKVKRRNVSVAMTTETEDATTLTLASTGRERTDMPDCMGLFLAAMLLNGMDLDKLEHTWDAIHASGENGEVAILLPLVRCRTGMASIGAAWRADPSPLPYNTAGYARYKMQSSFPKGWARQRLG